MWRQNIRSCKATWIFERVLYNNKWNIGIIAYVGEKHRSTLRPTHNSPESRQSRPEDPQYEAVCQVLCRKVWTPWIARVWYMRNSFTLFYDCQHLCKKKQRNKMLFATIQGYMYVVLKISLWKNVKIHDLFMYLLTLYFIQNPALVNELWVNGWDEASIREIWTSPHLLVITNRQTHTHTHIHVQGSLEDSGLPLF